jgi:hypothetical protein
MGEVTFVKYCPLCGAENPRQAAFCVSCMDGDLSTVPVEPQRAGTAPVEEEAVDTLRIGQGRTRIPTCTLELIENPAIAFTVRDGQTVGRNSKADVILKGVPNFDYISGCHARLFLDGEQWFVQHMGGTNFIKVDGEMYRGQEEVPIHDGSILVLSLTAFRLKV